MTSETKGIEMKSKKKAFDIPCCKAIAIPHTSSNGEFYIKTAEAIEFKNSITTRQLRHIIQDIQDSEMTVRDLLKILYQMNAQDETVPYSLISGLYNKDKKKD
jgi:hypothetical protein